LIVSVWFESTKSRSLVTRMASSNAFLATIPPPPPTSIPISTPPVSPVVYSPVSPSNNVIINNNPVSNLTSPQQRVTIDSTSSSSSSSTSVSNNNINSNTNTILPTSPTGNPISLDTNDDNKITINKREMRLGLRHRDSFAVHKQHLHQNPHGVHSNVNSMTNTVSITAPTMTRNASDPSLRQHQSSMSELFGNIPPSPSSSNNNLDINDILGDDLDLNNNINDEEGGPDDNDDDTTVTIDPSNESDVLRVLESMAINSPAQHEAIMKAIQENNDPNNNLTNIDDPTRKKNKLRSVIKGVGSYLGLRKSKKKRLAEAAQAAALAAAMNNGGVVPPGTIPPVTTTTTTSSSSTQNSDSNLLKRLLFRSKSSPSLQNDEDRLRDPTSPLPQLHTPQHQHHHTSSTGTVYTGPNRDEYGMYLPNHHRDTPARSIIKSPGNNNNSARRTLEITSPNGQKEKRRIVFLDIAYGEPLEQVRYCDDLHYSENSQHVDWDEEDDAGKCMIM